MRNANSKRLDVCARDCADEIEQCILFNGTLPSQSPWKLHIYSQLLAFDGLILFFIRLNAIRRGSELRLFLLGLGRIDELFQSQCKWLEMWPTHKVGLDVDRKHSKAKFTACHQLIRPLMPSRDIAFAFFAKILPLKLQKRRQSLPQSWTVTFAILPSCSMFWSFLQKT